MTTMSAEEINTLILKQTSAAWERGEPLLLSELGSLHDGEVANVTKKLEGRLSTYISRHLSDNVLLIQHSKTPPIIGVVPRNESTDKIDNFDAILEKKQSTFRNVGHQPRLHLSFWAAFRKLLEPELNRFIAIDGRIKFYNLDETTDPPSDSIKIEREYIAASDDEKDSEIFSKIVRWCNAHDLDIGTFQKELPAASQTMSRRYNSASGSTLDRLLDILDDSELRRMVIPLDVVKKLANR